MIKISVVTPVRNGDRFIRQTVESVLNQKGDFSLEYIVKDGCSSDDTLKILSEYSDRLTIISEIDSSPQEAINVGMARATGEIGCWLNADDIFEPGTLEAVIQTFEENPDKQWMYGKCSIVDEENREIRRPITWYKNLLGTVYSKNVLLCENYISQPATFWRMSLWRQSRDLNLRYKAAWDYELWLTMARHSPAVHVKKYLARHRRHEGSLSENHYMCQFKEELDIAKEYGNPIHIMIHRMNYYKIIGVYIILDKIKGLFR